MNGFDLFHFRDKIGVVCVMSDDGNDIISCEYILLLLPPPV